MCVPYLSFTDRQLSIERGDWRNWFSILRELTGGIYFGKKEERRWRNGVWHLYVHTRAITAKKGFELAMTRTKKIMLCR
jgi:isocitrate/isopropylmalate dehydrogenase